MAIFSYVPDRGFNKQTTPRVLTCQFGDGYAQRIADGINTINTSWDLSFSSKTITEAAAIIAFLEARAGVEKFEWTPPDETTQYNVICSDWYQVYDSHISRSISAKFTRVYL